MAARTSTGTYTATANSFNPAVTGTTIEAAAWNAILTEIEIEITDAVSRSGKGGMLADLDMSSNSIRNLASASAASDAVRFDQLTNLSASLASQVAVLSATYETRTNTLSATFTTLSAAHTTLSAAFTTLSAAHTTLSAAHTTLSAAFTTLSADFAQRDYLVLSAAGALANERVFAVGVGLSANDAGAGGAYTLSIKDGAVRDLASGSYVHGDIFYINASHNLVNLAPGTTGQFLKTQGASANPVWANPAGGGDMLAANNLSDVVNVASARANLGVAYATAADFWAATANKILESSATWAAAAPVTLTDAATVTCNFGAGINFQVTLGGNRTLLAKNAKAGQSGAIYISQSGGARTLSYSSAFKFAGGVAPTLSTALSTASGAWDVLTYHALSAAFISGAIMLNVK